MAPDNIIVTPYSSGHARELVTMWRASFERAVGIIDPHPIEEQLRYLEEEVIPANRMVVVLDSRTAAVIAFMASTPDTISQLYVHVDHQGRGIGSRLLDGAKESSNGRLHLFTFARNATARRFYERHGFTVVRFGFEPRWQLDDVEYEWLTPESSAPE